MPEAGFKQTQRERVILVHGLWMNGHAMDLLAVRLRKRGFDVSTFSYRSVKSSLTENAQRLRRFLAQWPDESLHLVAHSLGGVLVLETFKEFPELNQQVSRVVLAAPPYNDTYAGRALARHRIGNRIIGNTVKQWFDSDKQGWHGTPQLGVIAGTRAVGLGQIFRGLPQPNDGTIAVEETQVPGANEHIVMPVSHSEMLVSAKIAAQIAAFLRHGKFQ